MNKLTKLYLLIKELGISDVLSYGIYTGRLRCGIIRKQTPENGYSLLDLSAKQFESQITVYSANWKSFTGQANLSRHLDEAELILSDQFRPFGGNPVPIVLNPTDSAVRHWTNYSNEVNGMDIKKIWEPARFTWALELARGYALTNNEEYAAYFWSKVAEFLNTNPVNCGPNWASAQEVALRAINWILALGAFENSSESTSDRLNGITQSLWQHGCRILPTLDYARSQNNNHILSEALGLVIIGDYLNTITPKAVDWIKAGELEFEHALLKQIDEDGTYSQHSSNYHRMMLQLSLIYCNHLAKTGRASADAVKQRLAAASRWMIAQLDEYSGKIPNLGHNDGSLVLPFGATEYRDYRPTAQAASLAFLGNPCLPSGKWDELATWLGLDLQKTEPQKIDSPAVHKIQFGRIWGTLRGVEFHGRPAHADQLHVDLWWDGVNIARDAGTYSYNDPAPWQNALDSTRVHNTITIDELDQMTRVSRFLWLDQAQSSWKSHPSSATQLQASHDGYRKIGYRHTRTLVMKPEAGFNVEDTLLNLRQDQKQHLFTLHWLLPDWKWEFKNDIFSLNDGIHLIQIHVHAVKMEGNASIQSQDISLIRGGKTLSGTRQDPILGWESDTYAEKHPALSLSYTFQSSGSITIITDWKLIHDVK